MLIRNIGRVTKLRDIEPGTLFSSKIRNDTCVALAIEPLSNQPYCDALLLSPGHPDLDGAPGVLFHSVFARKPIFAFDDATIEYRIDAEHLKFEQWDASNKSKTMYLLDRSPYVKFTYETFDEKIINLMTGRFEAPDITEAATVSGWRIVWTDAQGETHPICSF